MDGSARVSLTTEGGIARLTLVRAEARNAIDPAMVEALADAVERCDGARALLIAADGPSFSVGGDLRYMAPRVEELSEGFVQMIGRFHEALIGIAQLPCAVVCAVRGAVAGGALGLLWCADVTICAADAKLVTGFMRLGLSGDGGSSWWLPRLVGVTRARELLLAGRPLSGAEAADWGLVTRAVPADEVDGEALRVAHALAESWTPAYAETRRLLAQSFERDLHDGLAAEHEAMIHTAGTDEARARIADF